MTIPVTVTLPATVILSVFAFSMVSSPDEKEHEESTSPATIVIDYANHIQYKGLSETSGSDIYHNFPRVTYWWLCEVTNVHETPNPASIVAFNDVIEGNMKPADETKAPFSTPFQIRYDAAGTDSRLRNVKPGSRLYLGLTKDNRLFQYYLPAM